MASRKKPSVDLTVEQQRVLEMAIEFYIRLGLGQFSQIAQRIDILHGKRIGSDRMDRIRQLCEEMEEYALIDDSPMKLGDERCSIYTLTAFLLESRMACKPKQVRWAQNQIDALKEKNGEKIT
jgi:hypothetical protein